MSGYPAIQLGHRRIFAKFEYAKKLIIPFWLSGARLHSHGYFGPNHAN